MSDRVVVMRAGGIEQVGSPRDVYERPVSEHVARFMGHSNVLEARVEHVEGDGVAVRLGGGELVHARGAPDLSPGLGVALVVRPEGVRLDSAPRPDPAMAPLSGHITGVSYQGSVLHVSLRLHTKELLRAEVQNAGAPRLEPGSEVQVTFAPDAAWVIPRTTSAHGED